MTITGKIFDIVKVNDKVVQVIVRKKDRGKFILTALTYIGYWKDKLLENDIKQKDTIRTNYVISSREYNGKYYTEIICREVAVIKKAPTKLTQGLLIDIETGELKSE